MSTRTLPLVGGLLVGLGLFGLTALPLFAQTPPATPTHEQMHQMMDAMHGEGTSQRMHEAMGPEAEQLMDQCVAMMGMRQHMPGMMGRGGMSGLMGGQNSQSMPDMRRSMMGR